MTRQRGMTLIELVISIVIIGICAAALFSAMAAITGRSADPLLRQQSLAIAEAYLEEILTQPYFDPASGNECPSPPASRVLFDNVCDYNGLDDSGARDSSGNALAALANYRVQVAVGSGSAWAGVPAGAVLSVDVTVTDPQGQTLLLRGLRTRY
ncbi:type II secretion system protein [Atopomonas sediminilitoris]|uniref:type II secretion system protein n=1 Tax=Atopomonas sediminilitoris TaxID=2919919 RepID=UPI001F4F0F85|nr:type II secretion system protein [Atopomonas sediminilitoris]MCJ8168411.1 type II secretion system GspH family protein [Atopomonas sediminilitoris]